MKPRSLVVKLILLSAAGVLIPALVLTIIIGTVSRHYIAKAITAHQTEVARRVAEQINSEIAHAQSVVAYVANLPAMSGSGVDDQRRALYNLLSSIPSVQEAMLLEQSNEILKVSRSGEQLPLLHRNGLLTESYVSAPFFAGNQVPTLLMSQPVQPLSNKARAVMVKISFSGLGDLMQQTRIGTSGLAYIVNSRGSVLAHPDPALAKTHADVSRLPVIQAWQDSPNNPTELKEFSPDGGAPVLSIAYPIPLLKSAVVVQQSRDEVFGVLRQMQNRMVAWTAIALIILLGLTIAVAWRILKPLRQMQKAAQQIGEGNLDVQLSIHTRDELEDLGVAFDQMAESLRRLDTARKDLMNMIIHDLKTPLSNIMAGVEYLLSGEAGPLAPEQSRFLSTGRKAGHEMLLLIQNLLDVARLEEGRLVLKREIIAPMTWAEKIVTSFIPGAQASHKSLRLHAGPRLPEIEGDVALLNRVLANLVANALAHTPIGLGEVTVALTPATDYLVLEVRDNGEGIPLEDQPKIFEKFMQGHRVYARSGSGLGLTFCKMVIEAHGGRIYVVSAPHQGSIFTIHFPYAQRDGSEETSLKILPAFEPTQQRLTKG